VRVLIPPKRNARVRPNAPPERNRNIRAVTRLGRRAWYRLSGINERERIENVFYRYKAILGREMRARTLAGQQVEARIGAKLLNTMASLGMPDSYRVA